MQKLFLFIMALLSLLSIGSPIYAQEVTSTPDNGWPVEERCVGEATKPPKDWSYDGTIIVDGDYGIHGLNSNLKSTYFIGYDHDNFHSKGEFSPNGKWYAVPSGTTDTNLSQLDWGYEINNINVYSTDNRQSVIHLNWSVSYRGAADMGGGLYAITPIHWVDDAHLIYESGNSMMGYTNYLINPFNGEQEILKTPFTSRKFHSISPNFKRTVYNYQVLDFSTGQELHTLEEANLPDLIFWRPDSSGFVSVTMNNQTTLQITLYDQDGQFLDVLYKGTIQSFLNIVWQWGSDSDQFALVINGERLLIGSVSKKKIVDLCTSASGIAFSPDNSQLAYGYFPSKGNPFIAILNVAFGDSYIGVHYQGIPIKWIAG